MSYLIHFEGPLYYLCIMSDCGEVLDHFQNPQNPQNPHQAAKPADSTPNGPQSPAEVTPPAYTRLTTLCESISPTDPTAWHCWICTNRSATARTLVIMEDSLPSHLDKGFHIGEQELRILHGRKVPTMLVALIMDQISLCLDPADRCRDELLGKPREAQRLVRILVELCLRLYLMPTVTVDLATSAPSRCRTEMIDSHFDTGTDTSKWYPSTNTS